MNKDVMRDVSMDGHDFDLVCDHAGAMGAGPLSTPVKPRAPSAASSSPVSAAEAVARGWLSNAEYVDLMASLEEELMADVRADGALGGGVALCSLLPHSARSLVMDFRAGRDGGGSCRSRSGARPRPSQIYRPPLRYVFDEGCSVWFCLSSVLLRWGRALGCGGNRSPGVSPRVVRHGGE